MQKGSHITATSTTIVIRAIVLHSQGLPNQLEWKGLVVLRLGVPCSTNQSRKFQVEHENESLVYFSRVVDNLVLLCSADQASSTLPGQDVIAGGCLGTGQAWYNRPAYGGDARAPRLMYADADWHPHSEQVATVSTTP